MKLELESSAAENQIFAGDFPQSAAFNGNADERVNEMLKAGIKAAQEGNRAEARHLLLRVTNNQPENETAWLWLASISEYPEELLGFLNNVLRINPENERAIEWAKATQSLMAKTLVQRGINSSRENQKEVARQFFEQALAHDGENEMAWLWLASVADSHEQKAEYLEKVLSINPENETAQASLKSIRQQNAQALLKKANVAAISGDHENAREMLDELMTLAPEMEEAWILKAYLSPSHDEKLECFNQVLTINPENETAQAGIASLNALKEREMEAAAQRAELENLQAAAAFQPETAENDSAEPVAEFSPAEESGIFDAPEQFVESESPFLAEAVAELAEEEAEEDGPTQELDESYLQTVKENAPYFFQTEAEPAEDFDVVETKIEESPVEFSEAVEQETVSEEISEDENHVAAAENFEPEAESFETAQEDFDEAEAVHEFDSVENNSTVAENKVFVEYTENDSVESDNYAFFTANSYPESFEQKLSEGLFETEHEESLMEESFDQNVEPSFEEYELSSVAEDSAAAPEPEPFFENEAQESFEMPQPVEMPEVLMEQAPDSFEQPPVEFTEEDYSMPEEISAGAMQVEENDSVENYFSVPPVEETKEEVPVEEAATVEEEPAPKQVHAQPEPIPCPFCQNLNEPQAFVCHSCRAMLSLTDVEMMLSNTEANKEVIEPAVQEMEAEKQKREFSADEMASLGIAHLNIKNLRKGFNYLQEAVQMNPNNVILAAQVHSLAIRLAEIEEQEQSRAGARKRTIMVVDDSPTVRKLVSGKLEKCGHTVVLAVDGMDALAKINDVTPDLILLDITMPRLDGYQVCKLIRNNDATKDVPVVMISGRDGFFDKVRGRMAGSTGYITKPFGPDTLMKTIEAYI